MQIHHAIVDKPNYLIVSCYVGETYIWGYESFDRSLISKSDIGVWKIKYKNK